MNVEQEPPNKPNFLLVLILFAVAVLVILVAAWIFLRGDANHLGLRHQTKEPHSQLVLPRSSTPAPRPTPPQSS